MRQEHQSDNANRTRSENDVKRLSILSAIRASPTSKAFLAGTCSGACSTLLFQPLDLIKTRIQTQLLTGLPIQAELFKVYPVIQQVWHQDGLRGFWRGTVPTLYRTVPGYGIYFSSIHFLQTLAGPECGSACHLITGISGRLIASLAVLPFTVIKARTESGLFIYTSMYGALQTTITSEGLRSLYSGFLPTILRDAPFSGLYLVFYEGMKKHMDNQFPNSQWRPVMHFGSGITAGMLASIVTHPFDVIKTQIQLTSDVEKRSLLHTAQSIWRKNGLAGYFAGILPRIVRRTLVIATSWTVYEQIKAKFFAVNNG